MNALPRILIGAVIAVLILVPAGYFLANTVAIIAVGQVAGR